MFKIIEYKSIDDVRNNFDIQYDDRFIFRGESNGHGYMNENWDLTSSFKRYFVGNELSFQTFIAFNLEAGTFSGFFNGYNYPESDKLPQASYVEKLYFLQHYGLPTCFLDFTRDPCIALYFAIAGLRIPYGRQYNDRGYISFDQDRFIKVYQLDVQLLRDIFRINDLDDNNYSNNYNRFKVSLSQNRSVFMAIDTNPLDKISYLNHHNLKNQEGCFILFDNTEDKENISLNQFLLEILEEYNKNPSEFPVIIEHRFYLSQLRGKDEKDSIFHFIRNDKRIRGDLLFNDIQGLKNDLMQIHDYGW